MDTCSSRVRGVGFWIPPALWVLLIAALAPALSGAAPQLPGAEDILTRYAENRDKIRSFAITIETQVQGDSSWVKQKTNDPVHTTATLRSDGDRIAWRRDKWGTFIDGTKATKDQPRHGSGLWDGTLYYQYNQGLTRKDSSWVIVTRPQSEAEKAQLVRERGIVQSPAAPSLGQLAHDTDRVDEVLRQARSISVSPAMERVGESDCYVVEAETSSGRYKLWFDPEHGYNIAKAIVDRKAGDTDVTRTLKGDMVAKYTYENVRFEKFGDVWVPVEGDRSSYQTWRKGRFASHTSRWKIVEFQLDPDHEALGSFRPDDIRDGARVLLKWARGIEYRWKDGGFEGQVEKSALDSLVHEVTQIKAEADTSAVQPDGVLEALHVEKAEVEGDGESHARPAVPAGPSVRTPAAPPVSQAGTKPPVWPMAVGVVVLLVLAVIVGFRRVLHS